MHLNNQQPDASFNGAAIIDEQGHEIPITESMIQQACERLETLSHYPARRVTQSNTDNRSNPVQTDNP